MAGNLPHGWAWVPRQYSTGGKTRLGRITKRGDGYLRTLLMLGARAVLQDGDAPNGSLVAMGTGSAGTTRLSPSDHRGGGEECPHHLGVAGAQRRIQGDGVAKVRHRIFISMAASECENAEQVRPASGHPD
jgi:hypothetical protein